MVKFYERLKVIRKKKGNTQKEVAEALGFTIQTYQIYEHGRSLPGFEILLKLAECFDVSVDYLMGRTEDIYRVSNGASRTGSAVFLDDNEKELLLGYRNLDDLCRGRVLGQIAELNAKQK
ncbi:hypothetical protein FACS1894188_12800 [Clostridia bacterium]|nr:hypothetical protein FACS1894188_12800 [Clostridia bacterium]